MPRNHTFYHHLCNPSIPDFNTGHILSTTITNRSGLVPPTHASSFTGFYYLIQSQRAFGCSSLHSDVFFYSFFAFGRYHSASGTCSCTHLFLGNVYFYLFLLLLPTWLDSCVFLFLGY